MPRIDATTDFTQYTKLRADAEKNPSQAIEKTAHQFEALFTQMMLKSMRAATKFGDDGLGSQGDMYKDWFDQQLAVSVSAGKGLGIADMLVAQLKHSQSLTTESAKAADTVSMTMPGRVSAPASAPARPDPVALQSEPVAKPLEPVAKDAATNWPPASRHDFLAAIWPHARRAAEALGISAHTLVAQAALETGWGKHMPHDADGKPSFNLFGIKADHSWSGATTSSATHEVVQGVEQKSHASFRSYGSIANAFDDYVKFLKGNPRYADALRHGGDGHRFAASLQKAGYASDPNYAAKIHTIATSPVLNHVLMALRASGALSV